jgi:hypothetical protein
MRRWEWLSGKVSDWKERYKICPECGDYLPLNASHFHGPEIAGQRVEVAPFEMVANPTVRWNEVNRTRYNVLDRSHERMRQAVEPQ